MKRERPATMDSAVIRVMIELETPCDCAGRASELVLPDPEIDGTVFAAEVEEGGFVKEVVTAMEWEVGVCVVEEEIKATEEVIVIAEIDMGAAENEVGVPCADEMAVDGSGTRSVAGALEDGGVDTEAKARTSREYPTDPQTGQHHALVSVNAAESEDAREGEGRVAVGRNVSVTARDKESIKIQQADGSYARTGERDTIERW
jgi:hypothetical protein